jgi:hypothetical protein
MKKRIGKGLLLVLVACLVGAILAGGGVLSIL